MVVGRGGGLVVELWAQSKFLTTRFSWIELNAAQVPPPGAEPDPALVYLNFTHEWVGEVGLRPEIYHSLSYIL